ncbi:MAG: hypothetical protein AAFP80_08055 [Pseudomonadota bacterium]
MTIDAQGQEARAQKHREMVAMLIGKINQFDGDRQQAAEALRRNFDAWLGRNATEERGGNQRAALLARFERALADAMTELEGQERNTSSIDSAAPPKKGNEKKLSKTLILIAIALLGSGVFWLAQTTNGFQNNDANLLFQLDETTVWFAPPENTLGREEGEKTMVITSSVDSPMNAGRTGGVSVTLPAEIEAAASGRTIEIKINAQQPVDNPSDQFAVAYSTAAVGNSGWRRFNLGVEPEDFSFDYDVPNHPDNLNGQADYLGIWADTSGSGRGVQINDLTIRLVNEEPAGE